MVARELGLEKVPCKFVLGLVGPEGIEEYVIKDNLLRRHLEKHQRAMLNLRLFRLKGGSHGGARYQNDILKNNPVVKELSIETGLSTGAIARDLKYARIVEQRPEFRGKKQSNVLRQVKKEKDLAEIKKNPPKQPTGKYSLIVCDPPWPGPYEQDGLRGAGDYPTMSLEQTVYSFDLN